MELYSVRDVERVLQLPRSTLHGLVKLGFVRPARGPRGKYLFSFQDLIVLRALSTMGPQHAYGLTARLEQVAEHPLELNQGTLYPALVRLEQQGLIKGAWQKTENNRDAKYYAITKADGTFTLPNLPPGTYTVAAWQEMYGTTEQTVTIAPKQAATTSFVFKAQ